MRCLTWPGQHAWDLLLPTAVHHMGLANASTVCQSLVPETLTVCRCKQTVRWAAGSGRSAWELLLCTAVHLGLLETGLAKALTEC